MTTTLGRQSPLGKHLAMQLTTINAYPNDRGRTSSEDLLGARRASLNTPASMALPAAQAGEITMNMTLRCGIPALALLLLIGLVGCGGSGTDYGAVPQSALAGPGAPPASGPPTPPPCTPDRYALLFYSPNGPFTGEPRAMRAALDCVGKGVAGAAIDWTVTAGDGSIGGSRTVRTLTDSSGVAEVTWSFGPTEAMQAIEAVYNGGSKPLRGSVAHTRIDVGPNRCEAAGGTDLGTGRTVSASETWTKAQSPYFTQCTTTSTCAGEVLVSNGAVLTVEPGVAVCVNRIIVEEAGRVVAAGTPAEPIHFGVRNRADHWSGLELRTSSSNTAPTETSVIKHAVIENALDIKVPGHPIVIEDAVMRRVAPASRMDQCTNFSIRQHAIAKVEPSRVLRTVVDGLGGSGGWEWDDLCPAVRVGKTVTAAPLVLGMRVVNARGDGVHVYDPTYAPTAGLVQLTQCEISGSAYAGLTVVDVANAATAGVVLSACNIFGNIGAGAFEWGQARLDARGNWWGDPTGPEGPQGDGVSGNVDTSNPLTSSVTLGY